MSKNIVLFSDGTGQEGGRGHDTNVHKLFNMIEDRTGRQISFYDRGLGAGWRKVTGNVSGMGISKNILECYQFIFEHFSADDEIFLFGFSRGATTVRSLSGFLHLFGILPKSRPELIKRAYQIYKIRKWEKRERLAREFVNRHHNMWCKVKFLGVWDTVAALGLPIKTLDVVIDQIPGFRHRFHDLRLSKSVVHARHALAIDDERLVFHPTLWDEEIAEDQTMKQVWFAGMHTDVGGGYPEQGLSDIALAWMLSEAVEYGLLIYPKHRISLNPDPYGTMHDSRQGGFKRFYRRCPRSWDSEQRGEPLVHQSVTLRAEPDDQYKPWILDGPCEIPPWSGPTTDMADHD